MPSVMRLFGALGGLDDLELRATFNGGIGMIVVVAPEAVPAAIEAFATHGVAATRLARSSAPRSSPTARDGTAASALPGGAPGVRRAMTGRLADRRVGRRVEPSRDPRGGGAG